MTLVAAFAAVSLVALVCGAVTLVVALDAGARRAFRVALLARLGRFRPPRYAILGDSLAQQCDWRSLGSRPFDVARLAYGGATIKDVARQALEARVIGARCLVIDGGLNDLLFDEAGVEAIDHDFRALLRRIDEDQRAIVTLMPYVADAALAPRIDEANRILRALAEARGFAVLDLNPFLSANGARLPEMTDDGLHFTPRACGAVVAAVRRSLFETGLA